MCICQTCIRGSSTRSAWAWSGGLLSFRTDHFLSRIYAWYHPPDQSILARPPIFHQQMTWPLLRSWFACSILLPLVQVFLTNIRHNIRYLTRIHHVISLGSLYSYLRQLQTLHIRRGYGSVHEGYPTASSREEVFHLLLGFYGIVS